MVTRNLALHEIMEMHEMVNFKTICMTKSKLLQGIVFDKDLKALLGKDVEQSVKTVEELQSLLGGAQIH